MSLLLAFSALADEVTLINGDMIRGKVTGLDGGKVSVTTDFAGDVQLDWMQVRRVTTDDLLEVELRSGARVRGRLVDPEEALGTAEDEPAATAPILTVATDRGIYTVPTAQVREIGKPGVLGGYIELGYAFSRGNSDVAHAILFRGGASLVGEKTLGFLDAMAAVAPDGLDEPARRAGLIEGLLARRFGGPIHIDAVAEGFTDRNRGLDWRFLGGGGAGLRFGLYDDRVLYLDGGPVYVFDRRTGRDRSEVALRAAARGLLAIGGTFAIEGRALALQSLDRADGFRARVVGGPRIRLWRDLYAAGHVLYEYDNLPAAGARRTDVAFECALGWSF